MTGVEQIQASSVAAAKQTEGDQRDAAAGAARVLLYASLTMSGLTAFRVAGITLGDLAMIASLAAAITSRLYLTRKSYLSTNSLIILTLITVGGLVATARAIAPVESVTVIIRIIVVTLVLPWLLCYLIDSRERLRRSFAFFAAGGAICGSGTLLQAWYGPDIISGAQVTNVGRFTGFAQHVSDTGGITSVALILSIGLLVTAPAIRIKVLYLVFALSASIGLILSGSVSGLAAVVVGLAALVIRGVIKYRYTLVILAFGFAALEVAGSIQQEMGALTPRERLMQTLGLTEGGRYSTSELRIDTYKVALKGFLDHPVIGSGMDVASGVVDQWPAHNLLLASAYQGGVLMAAGVLLAVLRPFMGRWLPGRKDAVSMLALATALTAVVFSMTAPSLYNRYFWIPIALLAVAKCLALSGITPLQDNAGCSRSARTGSHRELSRLSVSGAPRR